MGRLAGKHRKSNHWIHPLASHYRINQLGFTTDAGRGNSASNYQRNIFNKEQLDSFLFVKEEMDFCGFSVDETPSTSKVPPFPTSEVPPFSTSQLTGLPSVDAEPSSTETEVVDISLAAPKAHDRTPPTDSSV